jgi:sarcosine oxidase alpha subunit family protein
MVPLEQSAAAQSLRDGRPATGSSFRLHRPRGPLCGEGWCGLCDGACTSDALRPRDRLRPLGRAIEGQPPWFWERRFLRPRGARRLYLEALRRGSSAPSLAAAPAPPRARSIRVEEHAVVVVGEAGIADGRRVDPAHGEVAIGIYGDVLGVVTPDGPLELRFDRLVLATGSVERLPPVAGNDLPGVVGPAVAAQLPAGARVAVWGDGAPPAHVEVVWQDVRAPERIEGRGRVQAVVGDGREIPCDAFLTTVRQPELALAVQAGVTVRLTIGELPVLVADVVPAAVELHGACAATGSGVPDVPPADGAFACPCEDVRVRDLRRAIADGFDEPELLKRRTGALTGHCQGRLCSATILALLRDAGRPHATTTVRPPAVPVTLAELAADG